MNHKTVQIRRMLPVFEWRVVVGEQDGIAEWSGFLVRSAPSRPYDYRTSCIYPKCRCYSPYLNGIGMNHVPYQVGKMVPLQKSVRGRVTEGGQVSAVYSCPQCDLSSL